ncbi:hypothetical protein CROQUDRAFT_37815 [Cronartium quercuum f. sp. fusiforme G11]|uniref:Chitin synthase n=1 Tax=Cronartium quercuum f. sp. fusiforme G11 TaxID=708437 RepID=A0A9P6NRE4_9BASI|nr:hypothetical protein CROQUDRAFT_37815 [Cronartium quercuum f. sp. fusiforme G11]
MSYPHHPPYPSQPVRAHSPNYPSPTRGPSPYSQHPNLGSPQMGPYQQSSSQVFYGDEVGEKVPLTATAAPIAGQHVPANYYNGHPHQNPQPGYPPHRAYSQGTQSIAASEDDWRRRARPIQRGITRRVKLTQGNFINDYPVPKAISNSIEKKYLEQAGDSKEFTHLRYVAATCDPDDFTPQHGWRLRTAREDRETELLIAITYYNEDKILFARTMHGVMMNIRDICKSNSKFWNGKGGAEQGKKTGEGWKRIVVSLIFDGIGPCDKNVLDVLATLGVYQDGIMKKEIDGKETVAHIFEYTTQLSIDSKPSLVAPALDNSPESAKANLVPVQLIFCLKQKNAKKINSHRWLFNAIATQLRPEVCILIDAGTKPGKRSLYFLWQAFHNNRNLGGACGEIYAMLKSGKKLVNPLVAAQNFEYKMSNILDKPLESAFGYVSVLPGAFSAYRYAALQGRPLQQYFHGDHTLADRLGKKGVNGMNIFTKNMFLAEDRILCFELVAKANNAWVLSYVKEAKGETDVPEQAAELISQRRRWLNGSFAASVYATIHFFRFYKSGHNPIRLLMFHVQAIFNLAQLVFTWFALANLWLTFSIIIALLPHNGIFLFKNEVITHWVNLCTVWVYLGALALQFVLALGNRPKGEQTTYVICMIIFGILSYYLLGCAALLTVKAFEAISFENSPTIKEKFMVLIGGTNGVLLAALVSTYGIYFIASCLYADPWHMFSSFPQYIALAPSFTNVLNVYAFCNLHDVSWGTKGSDKADALPSVKSTKEKSEEATVQDVVRTDEDLDANFKAVVGRAISAWDAVEARERPTEDDGNKTFRTRLVSVWMLSNAALAVAIANVNGLNTSVSDEEKKQSTYFNIILWSTFGLSAVRFIGSVYFWIVRHATKCCRKT